MIEKKFDYINLSENNLINLSLDFKFIKFNSKLFEKILPKNIEYLKLADLDYESLRSLTNYFLVKKLNKLINLDITVRNFLYDKPEDQESLINFLIIYKGDNLEEFTVKTKINFTNENFLKIIEKLNGDFVKKFTFVISANKKNINFDINKINEVISKKNLYSYYLPNNFNQIKCLVLHKILRNNFSQILYEFNQNNSYLDSSGSFLNYNNTILKNVKKILNNIRSFLKIKQNKIFKVEQF